MNFDQDVVEFVDVNSAVAKAENFGYALLEEGVITASWNENNFNLAGDQVIFSLTFQATQDVTLSEAITINSRYTVAEAYNNNGELFDVELAFNGSTELVRSICTKIHRTHSASKRLSVSHCLKLPLLQ